MWKRKLIWSFFIFGILKSSILFSAEIKQESTWKLSIAVPESNGVHAIQLSPTEHFHVVLENKSKIPQRIWKNSNSWGYPVLYFEVVDETGKKKIIRKQPKNWRKNAPNYWTLNYGEYLVYNISLINKDWNFVLQDKDKVKHLKIQALIDIPEGPQTQKFDVWTGLIKSIVYEIEIVNG